MWHCPSDTAETNLGTREFWDGSKAANPKSRSYGYIGGVYTNQGPVNGPDPNTGPSSYTGRNNPRIVYSMADFDAASDTVILCEQQAPAYPVGSGIQSATWAIGMTSGGAFVNCDYWKLAGRRPGEIAAGPAGALAAIQNVPSGCTATFANTNFKPFPGHAGMSNYGFADGHAKAMGWKQVSYPDFWYFKRLKPTVAPFAK
jgi:prepilin-type processing-associated H-X9-DG protein